MFSPGQLHKLKLFEKIVLVGLVLLLCDPVKLGQYVVEGDL